MPDYGAPPVVEASLGIQFDGLPNYNSLHAADFWADIKNEFPAVQEMAPLDPSFETFGLSDGAIRQHQIQLIQAPIQPRFFFVSADGSELVQLQRDRLSFNWRKRDNNSEYPRYPYVRQKLAAQLGNLQNWIKRNSLGELVPNQCEAVYVNRVPLRDGDGKQCGLSHFFPWLEGLKGRTEDGAFAFRRRLNDDEGNPVARLSFDLRYGTDQVGEREAQMLLLVRGRPRDPNIDACLDLIDAEREVIVETFTDVTSSSAHTIWNRQK